MDEHHWKFKVGSKRYDQYRAIRGQGFVDYPRIEVLSGGEWVVFVVSQPIAEEMLRLAAENEKLRAEASFAPDRVLEAVKLGERARIRLEVAAARATAARALAAGKSPKNASLRSIIEALDRIIPEE